MLYTIDLRTPGNNTRTHTQNHDKAVSLIATHLISAAPKGIKDKNRYVEALAKFAVRRAEESGTGYVSLPNVSAHVDILSNPPIDN